MSTETLYGRRPPQTPENPITTANSSSVKANDNQFFEDLVRLRSIYQLRQCYTALPPQDRILTPQEPREPVKPVVTTIDFKNHSKRHLEMVEARQKEFDSVLECQQKDGQFLSYNTVFDRVNFELAETDEQRKAVKADMEKEGITNLRERYRTPLSIITYVLDENGAAYGEDDLMVPVDIRFQRGAKYRIDNQSPEPEREQQTVEAGIVAKRKLADPNTPLHSKVVVISPPSAVKGTIYQDNFVNIYEADVDRVTGKRIIKMFLFACSLTTEEYQKTLTRLKPDYFNGATGSFDVWCLSNPVFLDSRIEKRTTGQIFNQEFRAQQGMTGEEDFQEILTKSAEIRQNYIDVVCGKIFNPLEIREAFNAVLNVADAIRREIVARGRGAISKVRDFSSSALKTFRNVKEAAAYWGKQKVEQIMGGCGISGGISLGGSAIEGIISSLLSRAVGGIFGSLKDKDYCIKCGACGQEIKCIVRKGGQCPKCMAVRKC